MVRSTQPKQDNRRARRAVGPDQLRWPPARVRALRRALLATQPELAERVGVSDGTVVSRWESDNPRSHHYPSGCHAAALERLALSARGDIRLIQRGDRQ